MCRTALCCVLTLSLSAVAAQDVRQVDLKDRRQAVIAAFEARGQVIKQQVTRVVRDMEKQLDLSEDQTRKLDGAVEKAFASVLKSIDDELAEAKDGKEFAAALTQRVNDMSVEGLQESKVWKDTLAKTLTKEQVDKWKKAKADAVRARVVQAINVRPAAPMLAPVRNNVDRYRGYMTSTEGRLTTRLQNDLTLIRLTCDLSEKQERKLTVALKGAVQRVFAPKHAELDEIVGRYKDDENSRELATELRDFYRTVTPLPSEDPKLWIQTINSTLTAEQQSTLSKERDARAAFERRVWVMNLILEIDRLVQLSAAQRQQIQTAIEEFEGSLPITPRVSRTTIYNLSESVRDGLLKPILTPQQHSQLSRPVRVPGQVIRR